MDISWDDARLFLAVAEAGSLSRAAAALGVAQPTVSRRLAELEAELGEPLFLRSVEGASLTAYGERLLEPARRMAEWAGELTRTAERAETSLQGVVRITAPPGVAFDFLAPFAAFLRESLPQVSLEVISTVRYLDLNRREADLALRIERPTQRDLECVAELQLDALPFVAPHYAKRVASKPKLADVEWVAWAPPLDALQPNPTLARLIPGFRPAFASDDFLVQLRAAEAGLGAIFLTRAHHRFRRAATLVELPLADFPTLKSGMYLVCARSALAIPRIRAVADLLVAELFEPQAKAQQRIRRLAPARVLGARKQVRPNSETTRSKK